ncbi:MAG: hypothetical protein ACOX75_01095 [Lachnospiraceae bacterium]|jgi:predicted DNA-binding protein
MPIEITAERLVDHIRLDVNVLSTAYDKNVAGLVREAIAQENIGEVGIYYISKDASAAIGGGVQFPNQLKQSLASHDVIVHRFPEKVNLKVLTQTQTLQFARWFGDWQDDPVAASKIVNADGSPKIMYFESDKPVTDFTDVAKKKGEYGEGHYFTEYLTDAENIYQVYLGVRRPLQSGTATATDTQIRRFLKAVESRGKLDAAEAFKNISSKDVFEVIRDVDNAAIGDMVEAVKLWNKANGTKYDGIIAPPETVVFEQTQIKSATANVGTYDKQNSDIRFSRKDGTYEFDDNNDRKVPEVILGSKREIALKKGDMINEFYDRLTREQWAAYYQKLNNIEYNPDFYADGDVAYMELGELYLKLEMQPDGEFRVVDIKEGRKDGFEGRDSESNEDIGRKGLYGAREGNNIDNHEGIEQPRRSGERNQTDLIDSQFGEGNGEGASAYNSEIHVDTESDTAEGDYSRRSATYEALDAFELKERLDSVNEQLKVVRSTVQADWQGENPTLPVQA